MTYSTYKVAFLYTEFNYEVTPLSRRSQALAGLRHAVFGPKLFNALADEHANMRQYANSVINGLSNYKSKCELNYILSKSKRLHVDAEQYWELRPKSSDLLIVVIRNAAILENIKGFIAQRI